MESKAIENEGRKFSEKIICRRSNSEFEKSSLLLHIHTYSSFELYKNKNFKNNN